MKKSRRWLYLVLCAGLIALGAGGGTFASFNAQTTNKANTFSTGTLTLTDNGNCASKANSTNIATTCAGVLDVTTGAPDGPPSAVFGTITIHNTGSLTAAAFSLFAKSSTATLDCTNTRTATVSGLNGSSNLCTALVLFVEEIGQTTSGTSTHCWFGSSTTTLCAATGRLSAPLTRGTSVTTLTLKTTATKKKVGTFATGSDVVVTTPTGRHSQQFKLGTVAATSTTLSVTSGTTTYPATADASFSAGSFVVDVTHLATATAHNTVKYFDSHHGGSTTGISLTALKTTGATTPHLPALGHGSKRKFLVGVYLPATTGNAFQGLSASFTLTWRITQT